jgi:hypothetical protein
MSSLSIKLGSSIQPRHLRALGKMEINSLSVIKDSKNVNIPNQDKAFVFFHVKRIMSDRVLPGQTVNQKHWIEFLSKLRERVRGKGPQLQENG